MSDEAQDNQTAAAPKNEAAETAGTETPNAAVEPSAETAAPPAASDEAQAKQDTERPLTDAKPNEADSVVDDSPEPTKESSVEEATATKTQAEMEAEFKDWFATIEKRCQFNSKPIPVVTDAYVQAFADGLTPEQAIEKLAPDTSVKLQQSEEGKPAED